MIFSEAKVAYHSVEAVATPHPRRSMKAVTELIYQSRQIEKCVLCEDVVIAWIGDREICHFKPQDLHAWYPPSNYRQKRMQVIVMLLIRLNSLDCGYSKK